MDQVSKAVGVNLSTTNTYVVVLYHPFLDKEIAYVRQMVFYCRIDARRVVKLCHGHIHISVDGYLAHKNGFIIRAASRADT